MNQRQCFIDFLHRNHRREFSCCEYVEVRGYGCNVVVETERCHVLSTKHIGQHWVSCNIVGWILAVQHTLTDCIRSTCVSKDFGKNSGEKSGLEMFSFW